MDIEKIKKQIVWEEKLSRNPQLVKQRVALSILLVCGLIAGLYYWTERTDRMRGKLLDEAQLAISMKSYDRSAQIMADIVRDYPDFDELPEVLLRLAETYDVYLNESKTALYYYLLVVKDFQDTDYYLRATEEVARLYKYEFKNYGEALVVYQKLLDLGGKKSDKYQYEVADCYFSLNNFEQARIELENLIQNFPETSILPEATFRIGMAHYLEASFNVADEKFNSVIAQWPTSGFATEAHYFRAGILEDQDRLVEALSQYETIKKTYPNPDVINKKIERVKVRIAKKKKAI